MRKLILATAILLSTLSFAQPGERVKMTPEERMNKQLNEMTTSLNLTEKQQADVKALLMEQSKRGEAKRAEMKAAREKGEKLTDEQRAEMRKKMIDDQLEMKTKLKKILTEEQLKKMQEIRKGKSKTMVEKRKEGRRALKKEE